MWLARDVVAWKDSINRLIGPLIIYRYLIPDIPYVVNQSSYLRKIRHKQVTTTPLMLP